MLITLFFIVVFCGTVSAANYTVGPGSSYNYSTISSAVAAASNGDNITVYSNNGNPYIENIVISRNLTLKANGQVTVKPSNSGLTVIDVYPEGSGSTIQGFTLIGPDTASGISVSYAHDVKVINNTIINCTNGVYGSPSNNTVISGNTIKYTGSGYIYGVYLDGSSNEVSKNTITITGNSAGDSRGIHTWGNSHKISGNTITITGSGTSGAYGISLNSASGNGHNIEISGNTIQTTTTGNSIALELGSTFSDHAFGNNILGGKITNFGTNNHLNFNRIIGNSIIVCDGGVTLDALYNWYGSNDNPSSKIITYSGSIVNYDPWLILNVTAPSTAYTGGTSQITADFTHDSAGGFHNPASGHFPDGIPVTFTTTMGSIVNPSYTVNGVAQSTLISGLIVGTSNISTTLDSQTLNKSVIIVDNTPPKLITTYPKSGTTGFSRTATITVRFSENIKVSINWSKVYIKNMSTGKLVSFTKSIAGNTLYLRTTYKRNAYNWYQVYIPAAAIKDYAGNNLATGYVFGFKTGKY